MPIQKIPTSVLVENQLPGFVTDPGTSLLPRFLEYYYEFMESEDEFNNFTRDILRYFDSKTTSDAVLDWNFEEFKKMPHVMEADKRKLAKRIYDFYKAKGTEESVKMLFRAFYDLDVSITYPSENILRASDGKWSQESEIVVRLTYGAVDTLTDVPVTVELTDSKIVYKRASRVSAIGSNDDYWFTFPASEKIKVDVGNRVTGRNENGDVIFVGIVQATPSTVRVNAGGKGFRVGQIFRVPGTIKDSVFKISRVGTNGVITACSMIQFGYGHQQNQTIAISPYKSAPVSTTVDYSVTVPFPNVNRHLLQITEILYSISENLSGPTFSVDSRVQEQTSSLPSSPVGLTTTTFLESVASVTIVSSGYSKYDGKFTTNDGRISNSSIVLQDNYFYQAYSYVIHGDVNLTDYQNTVLNLTHPAGMLNFANMVKTTDVDVSSLYSISRVRKHIISIADEVGTSDYHKKSVRIHIIGDYETDRYAEYGYWDERYSAITFNNPNPVTVTDDIVSEFPPRNFQQIGMSWFPLPV